MCNSALVTICDALLSSFGFKFNLRRYNLDVIHVRKDTTSRIVNTAGRCS
jgi:hypothetical protein